MREVIKKSNEFILGRFTLTLNEQKILLLGISQIDMDDTKYRYKINLNEIDSSFLERKNTSRLKQSCDNLMRSIEIPPSKENPTGFRKVSLTSFIEYYPETQEIEIEFHEKLVPYLVDLKNNFTTYHIKNVLSFNSNYSIRFYEILRKDINIQKEKIKRKSFYKNYELSYLFDIFEIPKSLQQIGMFKKEILNRIKKEINSKSDLHIDYELIKEGKKFTKIKFTIRENLDISQDSRSTTYYRNEIKKIEKFDNNERMEHGKFMENIYENCLYNTFIDQHFLLNNNLYRLTDIKRIEIKEEQEKGAEVVYLKEEDKKYKFCLDLVLKDTEDKRTKEVNFNHANYENLYNFLNPLHTNI